MCCNTKKLLSARFMVLAPSDRSCRQFVCGMIKVCDKSLACHVAVQLIGFSFAISSQDIGPPAGSTFSSEDFFCTQLLAVSDSVRHQSLGP